MLPDFLYVILIGIAHSGRLRREQDFVQADLRIAAHSAPQGKPHVTQADVKPDVLLDGPQNQSSGATAIGDSTGSYRQSAQGRQAEQPTAPQRSHESKPESPTLQKNGPTSSASAPKSAPRGSVMAPQITREIVPQKAPRRTQTDQWDSPEDTFDATAPWWVYDPDALPAVQRALNASLKSEEDSKVAPQLWKNKLPTYVPKWDEDPTNITFDHFEPCWTSEGPSRRRTTSEKYVSKMRRATCPRRLDTVECKAAADRLRPSELPPVPLRAADHDEGRRQVHGRDLRFAYVLSQHNERFQSTKEILSKTGYFQIVRITPVDIRSEEVVNYADWENQTWRSKVYSNYLSFLNILEEIQKLHTCSGRKDWAYVFEDDIQVTSRLDPSRIPSLLAKAEADADARGQKMLYAGVCMQGYGNCHFREQDRKMNDLKLVFRPERFHPPPEENRYMSLRCSGGCAHAWAVKTSSALELRNFAVGVVRYDPRAFFDCFLQGYSLTHDGIMTPAAGFCLDSPEQKSKHCGIFSQNRKKFKTTIASRSYEVAGRMQA